jgi:GNAT superfamily N-acetyltransferase
MPGVDDAADCDSEGPAARGAMTDLSLRGPLLGQGAAAERILRALPGWFGIEAALQGYVRAADELDTFVAMVARPACGGRPREVRPDEVIGFLTLRETSPDALELHVMGVLPSWHRRGAGRALVERAASYARAEGYSLLHVKTLAPSDPDPGYAATRAFYASTGFRPLEVLPQVWGPENPCLLLVRPL